MKSKLNKLGAGIFICLAFSCTKENITTPSAATSRSKENVTQAATFAIGQEYGGGYILYIDPSGLHGLIVAKEDVGLTSWSGGAPYSVTGASGYTIGTGRKNTKKIITAYGNTGSYAALLCKRYRGGGLRDWFLPTSNELSTIIYNNSLYANNVANLLQTYWASTEFDANNAGVVSAPNGQEAIVDKNTSGPFYVRPVRYF